MTLKSIVTDWSPDWRAVLDEYIDSAANQRQLGRYDQASNQYYYDGPFYKVLDHYEVMSTDRPVIIQVPGEYPTYVVMIPLITYSTSIVSNPTSSGSQESIVSGQYVVTYLAQGIEYQYVEQQWKTAIVSTATFPVSGTEQPGWQWNIVNNTSDKVRFREFSISSTLPTDTEPWREAVRTAIPPYGLVSDDPSALPSKWLAETNYGIAVNLRVEVYAYYNSDPNNSTPGTYQWMQYDELSFWSTDVVFGRLLVGNNLSADGFAALYPDTAYDGTQTANNLAQRFGPINGVSAYSRPGVVTLRSNLSPTSTARPVGYGVAPNGFAGATFAVVWLDNGVLRMRKYGLTVTVNPNYNPDGSEGYLDIVLSFTNIVTTTLPTPTNTLADSDVVTWSMDPWLFDDAFVTPEVPDFALPLPSTDLRQFGGSANQYMEALNFANPNARQSPIVIVTQAGIVVVDPDSGELLSSATFSKSISPSFRADVSASGPIWKTADRSRYPSYAYALIHVEAGNQTLRYLFQPSSPTVPPVYLGTDQGWRPVPRVGEDPDDAPGSGFYALGGQRYVTAGADGVTPVQYTDTLGRHAATPVACTNDSGALMNRPITAIVRSVTDLTLLAIGRVQTLRCQFVVAVDGSAIIVADTGQTPPMRLNQRDDGAGSDGHPRLPVGTAPRLPGGNTYV